MIKVLNSFCSGLIIFSVVTLNLNASPSFAQRAGVETKVASLLSRTCKGSGSSGRWNNRDYREVTIGRRLYTTRASILAGRIGQPFQVVCKVNSKGNKKGFGTLRLTFGLADNSANVPTQVRFYLNGNSTTSYTMRKGDLRTVLLDVSSAEDIAIEVEEAVTRYSIGSPIIYIFEDVLEPLN